MGAAVLATSGMGIVLLVLAAGVGLVVLAVVLAAVRGGRSGSAGRTSFGGFRMRNALRDLDSTSGGVDGQPAQGHHGHGHGHGYGHGHGHDLGGGGFAGGHGMSHGGHDMGGGGHHG
jgi:hypothetical protein